MSTLTLDGGLRAAVPFREVWCVDFEFNGGPGDRPRPVCMVAKEWRSGREIRRWRDELLAARQAPFDTGPNSVVVAYYAPAELGCFAVLGWPMPGNVLDLFVEHRVETNGVPITGGNDLLAALACRGLAHLDAGEKESMRRLILDNQSWSETEKRAILDYCASDVEALIALLPAMAPTIDWPRALFRGRYMAAVARMEAAGVPIDRDRYERLVEGWEPLKGHLVAEVDQAYGVYDGTTFKAGRFAAWLALNGIPWPRHLTGALDLEGGTFSDMSKLYPELGLLHELRSTLGRLRLTGLTIGSDGRNRCMLSSFRSTTGRNQPSNKRFIFGPSRWMRGLIRPPEGRGLAYIDFSAQEIGIAAALSGDERMSAGYLAGDPYLEFAKAVRLAPPDATKESHKQVRDRCKAVVLGINYGMGPESLARSAGITPVEARELLRLHKETYRPFWRFNQEVVDSAILNGVISTVFGWRCRVHRSCNPRSLMNFPMQANGAEMMRIAAIAATEAGIEVCAPIHDAFLITAPLERLDEDVARMQALMTRAGEAVTGGLPIRTEAKVIRWPDRYMDERGEAMWQKIMSLLEGSVQ